MFLPLPPSAQEKYLYTNQNKILIYSVGALSSLALCIGLIKFSISSPILLIFLPLIAIIAVYLILGYVIGVFGKSFDLNEHTKIMAKTYAEEYSGAYELPTVDIFYATCGEDLSVIANALTHIHSLVVMYPKATIYVLDDSKRVQVASLADQFSATYMIRDNAPYMKKAGNLRAAFARTSGEFIVIFDADFCPRQDFLITTLPYFREDEKLAIMVTPQFFEIRPEMSFIEQGAGFVQELFYRLVQVNRNAFGAPICVGTNCVYRRTALEPLGGTAEIGYSEDLHTGFNVTKAGWKVAYIPIILAKGLCPDTIKSFFSQQYRWAQGSISLFFNPDFWESDLKFMQKLCFLSGMLYYIATGIGAIFNGMPTAIMAIFFPEKVFMFNYIFTIPSFMFTTIIYNLWTKAPFTFGYFSARQTQYYAHFFSFIDKIFGSAMPWSTAAHPSGNVRYFLFLTSNAVLSSIYFLCVLYGWQRSNLPIANFIPGLFFTGFTLIVALFTSIPYIQNKKTKV
jgi:cellulose synthase/poly-beta-1,6-N-acetylglucosamine synthase-like glycosyltransferase